LFKDKQYYDHIHLSITILTSERNWNGQPYNCYIIFEGVWVKLTVDDAVIWCKHQWPTFWCIKSISTQYNLV